MRKSLYILLSLSIFLVVLFFICNYFSPLKINVDYSQCVYDKDSNIVHVFLTKDQKWRLKTSEKEISPLLKKVFLEKEDKHFYKHYGFNPFSMGRALFFNIVRGKKTSGASTITMQVARLLEPKKRTYGNKIIEIFKAIQIENQYTKDEILSMYFNLIPYGGNVEGLKSVSLLYLQKKIKKITLAEAMALAIIPNRPSSLNIKKNQELIVQERNKWLKKMQKEGVFTQIDIKDALKEPFTPVYKSLPNLVPQLAYRLAREHRKTTDFYTYISVGIQKSSAEILKNYVNTLKKYQIYNGAAIVIDNKSHEIVSYVGSNDFFDNEHAGQCDGVSAIRSPGSTLKPLLYAIAFDKGLITFQATVADVPCDIKGYAPENFDKKFRGLVSIETALLYSLNIPAVKVLDGLGVKYFVEKLMQMNFRQIKVDKDKLGHSVILGGCGTSLEELSNMYSAFANKGKYRAASLISTEKNNDIPIVSEAATYLLTNTLNKLTRPDVPNYSKNMEGASAISWKTGTSYGKRDAWCMGYTSNYTVGVWLGNFDNSPVAELVGVELAAPLLFEMFKSLPKDRKNTVQAQPTNLKTRIVCTESGLPPDKFCKSFTNDYFMPGVSDHSLCEHQKEYFVSVNERMTYCMDCLPETGYKKILYPNLSAEMVNYYDNNHIIYKKIPEHNTACKTYFNKQVVKIIHPQENKVYYTDEAYAQIKLECSVAPMVKKVLWYVDDKFIGTYDKEEEVFVNIAPKQSKISCTDDLGNTKHVYIVVKKM